MWGALDRKPRGVRAGSYTAEIVWTSASAYTTSERRQEEKGGGGSGAGCGCGELAATDESHESSDDLVELLDDREGWDVRWGPEASDRQAAEAPCGRLGASPSPRSARHRTLTASRHLLPFRPEVRAALPHRTIRCFYQSVSLLADRGCPQKGHFSYAVGDPAMVGGCCQLAARCSRTCAKLLLPAGRAVCSMPAAPGLIYDTCLAEDVECCYVCSLHSSLHPSLHPSLHRTGQV